MNTFDHLVIKARACCGLVEGKTDLKECLRLLVDIWRIDRSSRTADVIDEVTELAFVADPFEGAMSAERSRRWVAIAKRKDTLELPALLAEPWPDWNKETANRLNLLLEWPDDPRLAMALARLCADPPWHGRVTDPFFVRILERLRALNDLRVLIHLPAKPDQHPAHLANVGWRKAEEELVADFFDVRMNKGEPLPLRASVFAEIEEHFRHRQEEARVVRVTNAKAEEAHVEAILRAPDDDGARAVYADWLTERGDPRGEIIALQLIKTRKPTEFTPAMRDRERELLTDHAALVAGPLDRYLGKERRLYDRGFLVGGELKVSVSLEDYPSVFKHEAWSPMFRELSFPNGGGQVIISGLRDSAMRSLRAVHDVHCVVLLSLSNDRVEKTEDDQFFPPIDEVSSMIDLAEAYRRWFTDHADWLARDNFIKRLHLGVPPNDNLGWLVSSKLMKRLDHLTLVDDSNRLGFWLTRLANEPLKSFRLVDIKSRTTGRSHFLIPEGLRFNVTDTEIEIDLTEENLPDDPRATIEAALRSLAESSSPPVARTLKFPASLTEDLTEAARALNLQVASSQ